MFAESKDDYLFEIKCFANCFQVTSWFPETENESELRFVPAGTFDNSPPFQRWVVEQ